MSFELSSKVWGVVPANAEVGVGVGLNGAVLGWSGTVA